MARTYLLQINGPGGVAPNLPEAYSSPFVSAYAPPGDFFQYHFPYRAPDGSIWDVFSKPDPAESLPAVQEWDYQKLNKGGNTDGPAAVLGPWAGTYSDQQHFVYLDPDGTLWDSFYVNGSNNWHLQDINNGGATGGPPAAGDFVSIWTDGTGKQQHFTYLGSDRNVYDAFWDGDHNNWHFQHVNSGGADAPPAAGPPFACTFSMQQHIAYVDDSGKVWDCWYDGFGTWSAQLLNDGGRTALPLGRSGSNFYPWVWLYGAFEQHFSYLGTDGAVFDAYWDSQSWHANQLTHANAADFAKTNALAQAHRPTVTSYGATRHTFVMDSQGIIRDCWLGTGWELTQINGPGGLFPHCLPATGLPFAWSTQAIVSDGDSADGGENSSASVAWSDRNGTIWSAAVDSMPEQEVSV